MAKGNRRTQTIDKCFETIFTDRHLLELPRILLDFYVFFQLEQSAQSKVLAIWGIHRLFTWWRGISISIASALFSLRPAWFILIHPFSSGSHQRSSEASYGHRFRPYLVGFWSSEHATFSSSHASDWRRYTTFIHFSLTNHCHLVVKLLPTLAQDGIQVHGGPRQKSRKASDIPCTAVYDWWKDI